MERQLNFARVVFRNERLPRLLFGLVAFGLLVTTLWHGVVLSRYLLKEREELDLKVQSMEEELAGLESEIGRAQAELHLQRNNETSQQILFLADVFREKSFSWTGLFNQLETITPARVRITSISPSTSEGEIEVKLTTISRSLENLLELVRRLEESRFFGTVMPVSEAHEESGGGVTAQVTLRYLAEEERTPSAPNETTEGF
jgi:Tfp pilus assembly protein PilN